MTNNAIKKTRNQEAKRVEQRTLRLAQFVHRTLYDFVIEHGMRAFDDLLQAEQETLCGPAHGKGQRGEPVRWGKTDSRLVMGGRRIIHRRPRVRCDGKEVVLPAWKQYAEEDPLNERALEQIVLGVSMRGYDRSVEPVADELGPHGASKSSVSRRFAALTEEQLTQWLSRDLSTLRIAVVMIDGICVGDHTVVVALGIDEMAEKHVLGLWQGATENSTICTELLNNLVERGLNAQLGYLFVIDGSKAMRKAIRDVFGKRSIVQRCQEHKRRNVLDHLPKRMHPSISAALSDAFRSSSKTTAKKRLAQLAAALDDDCPEAAESIREGLDELIALKDMKLPTWLERTLSTTNPIENLNGSIRRITRNVKRWRDGAMVRRWIGASLLEAGRGFRRLRGYKGMPLLLAALGRVPEQTPRLDQKQVAA
jgi:transposase-like protein